MIAKPQKEAALALFGLLRQIKRMRNYQFYSSYSFYSHISVECVDIDRGKIPIVSEQIFSHNKDRINNVASYVTEKIVRVNELNCN